MDKVLGRFVPAQTLANVKEGARHPVRWVKGEGIPADHITPWELLLYLFHEGFKGMFDGFAGRQDFLYKEYYRIPPLYNSYAGTISSIWDAINDPILGGYMDRKRFGPDMLRKIMRWSAVTGTMLTVVKLFDGGMSHLQHLIVLVLCSCTQDILGTMNGVSDQKMRAGISPLTQQRGRIRVWTNIGGSLFWGVAGMLPNLLMTFQKPLGLSDYQIIFYGALFLMPLGIFAWILPTFIRQRVDYSWAGAAQGEEGEPIREKLSLRETFTVVRHNKYFIANSIAKFITVFSPDVGDEQMIYRYIMPGFHVFGHDVTGEILLPIKQLLGGFVSNFMSPFQRQIINKVGGPLRAQQLKCVVCGLSRLLMFFVGYKSLWNFAVLVVLENFFNAGGGFDGVAEAMLNYEWYDYVELKTGQRTEGVTGAVNALFEKIVTNNIGKLTGDAFLQWTGYRGGYKAEGTRPPERYLKFMWPMYTLIPVLDHTIWLICRSFVKWKPEDRERTELALAERRAAQAALEATVSC